MLQQTGGPEKDESQKAAHDFGPAPQAVQVHGAAP